jgi:hypothetical protein
MAKFSSHSPLLMLRSVGLGIFALSLGMGLSVLTHSKSQTQGKFFTKQESNAFYKVPLEATQITSPKGRLQFNEGFLGSDDWFKYTEFKIKNVSNEDIVYVELNLNFPDAQKLSFVFNLGNLPSKETIEKKQETTFLKPGEETTFKIDDAVYERLTKALQKRQPLSTIHKMEINFKFVHFKNGYAWNSGGEYLKQNPNNPRHYVPVEAPKPPDNKNISKK